MFSYPTPQQIADAKKSFLELNSNTLPLTYLKHLHSRALSDIERCDSAEFRFLQGKLSILRDMIRDVEKKREEP